MRRHLPSTLFAASLMLAACSSSSNPGDEVVVIEEEDAGTLELDQGGGEPDLGRPGNPGPDELVRVMNLEPVFFSGWDEGQNRRTVDVQATLPPIEQTYESIELAFSLNCPENNLCDWWDRLGSFGIVLEPGTDEETYVELSRFITPYRIGANWIIDVTDLRPLLAGEVTFRVFVDTWVGPGHANGDGWLVSAAFNFAGGVPERPVAAVLPVYTRSQVVVGDPEQPVADQLAPVTLTLPEGARSARLRTFITGHGQGNLDNCAEFCPQFHFWSVDGQETQKLIWRSDCDTSVPQNQAGNVTSSRAGWCPGGYAHDWSLTFDAPEDGDVEIGYRPGDYENSCRPGVEMCQGCAFDQGCEYNGSNHTQPNYQVSALLIAYE